MRTFCNNRKKPQKLRKTQKKRKKNSQKKVNFATTNRKFKTMKQTLLLFNILIFIGYISLSQNRNITSTATPGELYLTGSWYGIYNPIMPWYYDTLQTAVYRITENGKKLTIQYDADYFANPEVIMQPNVILADATFGVLYNKDIYSKNSYTYSALWVSFDYGKNWIFREENLDVRNYFGTCAVDGTIYTSDVSRNILRSNDYGESFEFDFFLPLPYSTGITAYNECEFYALGGGSSSFYNINYTNDCAKTFTIIPIDSQFIFGNIWGRFPDVYRGGMSGEVYISSMFPEENYKATYKVSFSADTGHTFRHVYVSELFGAYDVKPIFMSDRVPGVFYIVKSYQIEDFNPWGWHTKICVEYYGDYGETLVDTYCYDLTKNYGNGVGIKEKGEGAGDEVVLYPNPTFTTVTIEANNFAKAEIYNAVGQLLKTVTTKTIDVSSYNAGIYFLKVFDMVNNSVTKRVVVVR